MQRAKAAGIHPAESPLADDDGCQPARSELRKRAAEFTAAAKALPGSNDSKDRRLSETAFERTTAVLSLLAGPKPNGGFRQDQRIIEMIRQQLRTAPAGMAMDPAVDTGLRAIYNSLVNLRERWFPVDRSVGAQLDTLRDRVADLDSVRGPLHSVAAADCFVAAAALTETMAAQLEGRITSNADAAATQPSP